MHAGIRNKGHLPRVFGRDELAPEDHSELDLRGRIGEGRPADRRGQPNARESKWSGGLKAVTRAEITVQVMPSARNWVVWRPPNGGTAPSNVRNDLSSWGYFEAERVTIRGGVVMNRPRKVARRAVTCRKDRVFQRFRASAAHERCEKVYNSGGRARTEEVPPRWGGCRAGNARGGSDRRCGGRSRRLWSLSLR